jgi:biopolymer transport protein ExbD
MKVKRQSTGPVKETQMVSLADIAFLIIFFFMLSSTFKRDKLVVALPNAPKTAKTETGLSVTMDSAAKIYLNGAPVENADALQSELATMLAGKTQPKDCEVRFKCDKTMTYKDYKNVYQAISNAGGIIAIMHELRK